MLKNVFLTLWLISIAAFLLGQFSAPADYHLLAGNPWGLLFGSTVIVGIISFLLMFFFAIMEKKKNKDAQISTIASSQKKYNLSFGRLLSRTILAGIIGILFGIGMIPFLRVANGLLYQERQSIGSENIYRMIVLWGIFTGLFTILTFYFKRFRMVSVILIACWILSILIGILSFIADRNSISCKRSTPYPLPTEINRTLDLISQRMEIDLNAKGTILQSAYNFRNCLNIQYLNEDTNQSEGFYIKEENSDLQDLKVYLNPSYRNFDDLTLAVLLTHELIHVGQHINEVQGIKSTACYESEAEAFVSQSILMLNLNSEEQRSIYARLRENEDKNPIFKVLLLTDQRVTESYNACLELQKKNSLTQQQLSECTWTGAKNKLEQDIRSDPEYQEQCKLQ